MCAAEDVLEDEKDGTKLSTSEGDFDVKATTGGFIVRKNGGELTKPSNNGPNNEGAVEVVISNLGFDPMMVRKTVFEEKRSRRIESNEATASKKTRRTESRDAVEGVEVDDKKYDAYVYGLEKILGRTKRFKKEDTVHPLVARCAISVNFDDVDEGRAACPRKSRECPFSSRFESSPCARSSLQRCTCRFNKDLGWFEAVPNERNDDTLCGVEQCDDLVARYCKRSALVDASCARFGYAGNLVDDVAVAPTSIEQLALSSSKFSGVWPRREHALWFDCAPAGFGVMEGLMRRVASKSLRDDAARIRKARAKTQTNEEMDDDRSVLKGLAERIKSNFAKMWSRDFSNDARIDLPPPPRPRAWHVLEVSMAMSDPYDACDANSVKLGRVEKTSWDKEQSFHPFIKMPAPRRDGAAGVYLAALSERGSCTFVEKASALQSKGAVAMIVGMQDPSMRPFVMSGSESDQEIDAERKLIPSVMVSRDTAAWLRDTSPSKLSMWIVEHPGAPYPHVRWLDGTIDIEPNDGGWGLEVFSPTQNSNIWQLGIRTSASESDGDGAISSGASPSGA